MTDTLPKLYTMEEVAEHLHVSRRKLQDLIRDYPFYRCAGRRKLFTPHDLSQLIQALPCHSNSTIRGRVNRPTTRYAAHTSKSPLTELQELLTARKRRKSSTQ